MFCRFKNQSSPVLLFATPAKLNLFLEVHARRSDGFHEIQSVMSKFSLYDYLTFTPDETNEITLDVYSADVELAEKIPDGRTNLICRALESLRTTASCRSDHPMGMKVELFKRIPVEAGLGGASGNAAAALLAANELWGLKLPRSQLVTIAGEMGSDIPFFLGSGFCKCTGRGEQIENLNFVGRWNVLIAKPDFGISTPEIYSRCRVPEHPITIDGIVDAMKSGHLPSIGSAFFNRLESFAEEVQEGISRLRFEFSRTLSLGQAMTGSGSCYFGLYANHRAMMSAAKTLASRLPRIQLFHGHTLTNAFYSRSMADD